MSLPLESVIACIEARLVQILLGRERRHRRIRNDPQTLEVQNADVVIRHFAETLRQSSDKAGRVVVLACWGTD